MCRIRRRLQTPPRVATVKCRWLSIRNLVCVWHKLLPRADSKSRDMTRLSCYAFSFILKHNLIIQVFCCKRTVVTRYNITLCIRFKRIVFSQTFCHVSPMMWGPVYTYCPTAPRKLPFPSFAIRKILASRAPMNEWKQMSPAMFCAREEMNGSS